MSERVLHGRPDQASSPFSLVATTLLAYADPFLYCEVVNIVHSPHPCRDGLRKNSTFNPLNRATTTKKTRVA